MRDPVREYKETAVRGASPVGLIVMLYEEVIRSIRKAQRELASGNIEERTKSLSHAINVVGHLQAVLNFEKGGRIARDLSVFYDLMRTRILEANVKGDHQLLESIATEFSKIKETWHEVDRRIASEPPPPVAAAAPAVNTRKPSPARRSAAPRR
jgi:flagellar secretion chaperone FliS